MIHATCNSEESKCTSKLLLPQATPNYNIIGIHDAHKDKTTKGYLQMNYGKTNSWLQQSHCSEKLNIESLKAHFRALKELKEAQER